MPSPKVVISMVLYNRADRLPQALESLLSQTFRDFRLLLVDDCSTDGTREVARSYAAIDPRVIYLPNSKRKGMIGNWRHALVVAREMFPEAPYFAWASDHDLWHPNWLRAAVTALDSHPEVVLVYPYRVRLRSNGELERFHPWRFETLGVAKRSSRFAKTIRCMSAGSMMYGLFRAEVLRPDMLHFTVIPDRLFLSELSLYGQFMQIPHYYYYRLSGDQVTLERQIAGMFPGVGKRPLYLRLPFWLTHTAILLRDLGLRGVSCPRVSRWEGILYSLMYFFETFAFQTKRAGWRLLGQVVKDEQLRGVLKTLLVRPRDSGLRREPRQQAPARQKAPSQRPPTDTGTGHEQGVSGMAAPGLERTAAVLTLPVGLPLKLEGLRERLTAAGVDLYIRKALKGERIVVGPWLSEVGFELLYWIPFLRWIRNAYGVDSERMVVISRGGAAPWYRGLFGSYVDIFDLYSPEEFAVKNAQRMVAQGGGQKQWSISEFDREIISKVSEIIGEKRAKIIHPSLMYQLFRPFWDHILGINSIIGKTVHEPLAAEELGELHKILPQEYVAVKFYFNDSFPETDENRYFVTNVLRKLSDQIHVVALNTGLRIDEHVDCELPDDGRILSLERQVTPTRNLEIQTRVVSRAKAFIGTYGGFSYLAPLYGVPTLALYSDPTKFNPRHLDVARWIYEVNSRRPFVALDVRDLNVLELLLEQNALVVKPSQ